MTELRRLLDDNSDELALALLGSARDDSPSDDSLKATAVALGISTSLGGAALLASGLRAAAGPGVGAGGAAAAQAALGAAPAATLGALTLGVVAKQIGIGLVAGVLAMGGLELAVERPFSAPAPVAQKASISPARTTRQQGVHARSGAGSREPMAALVAAEPESDKPSAPASANDGASAHAAHRRVAPPSAAAVAEPQAAQAETSAAEPVVEPKPEAAKPEVALNKSLAAEVALLDRARSALLAQDPSGGQRALDQYRKERQTGILDPEATVLQIQVLEKLGKRGAAARLARQFIASHPESRHVDSLRVLAAEAP
jgi:hypothetical protein